jgi:Ca-activated chloride channel family protein
MTPGVYSWLASPWLLPVTGVVPLAAAALLAARLLRGRALGRLGSPLALRRLTLLRPRVRGWRTVALLLGLALVAVACAGPQWGRDHSQARGPGGDLLIALDLSRSMLAEQPSRRERAFRALRDLADALQARGGPRVALVAFASRADLLFPLTADYDHLRHTLARIEADDFPAPTLGPDEPFVSGTRIGAGLRRAVEACDPGRPGRALVVLLSDGDDPAGDEEWVQGAQAARTAGVPVVAVGLGDPAAAATIPAAGGPMKHGDQIVRTRLREDVLQEIARRTAGVYLPARTDAIPLGALLLPRLEQATDEGTEDLTAPPALTPRYAWFLLSALLLLSLTMALPDGFRTAARRPWLPPALAALAAVCLVSAAPLPEVEALVRAGNAAFDRQEFDAALEHYKRAEALSPDPGLVAFNKAAAYYRLEQYREAELHYRRALEDDAAPDPRRARAHYDLGNALARQAGEQDAALLGEAVAAYRAALAEPGADVDLQKDVRHNLETAQLLWLKAKARQPESPPDTPDGSEKPRPKPKAGGPDETKQAGDGSDTDPDGTEQEGPEGPAGKRPSKHARAGPLRHLPNDERVVPLTAEEVRAHLERNAERIARERRDYYQQRPAPGAGKDW